MRIAFAAVVAVAMLSTPSLAAPCRDAKGHFTKCSPKAVRCKDAKGKFTKCGAPGAKPV